MCCFTYLFVYLLQVCSLYASEAKGKTTNEKTKCHNRHVNCKQRQRSDGFWVPEISGKLITAPHARKIALRPQNDHMFLTCWPLPTPRKMKESKWISGTLRKGETATQRRKEKKANARL